MRITRKQYQLLLIGTMFFFVAAFATGYFPTLSIIQGDKPFLGSFTIGDGLTLFGLFGTCATIAIWLSYYKRIKRK